MLLQPCYFQVTQAQFWIFLRLVNSWVIIIFVKRKHESLSSFKNVYCSNYATMNRREDSKELTKKQDKQNDVQTAKDIFS